MCKYMYKFTSECWGIFNICICFTISASKLFRYTLQATSPLTWLSKAVVPVPNVYFTAKAFCIFSGIFYNSQNKQIFLSMIQSMDLQPFYGKGPHPSLWASSQVACEKTAPSSIYNCLNYCEIFIVYTQFTIWPQAAKYNLVGWRLETHDLEAANTYIHSA